MTGRSALYGPTEAPLRGAPLHIIRAIPSKMKATSSFISCKEVPIESLAVSKARPTARLGHACSWPSDLKGAKLWRLQETKQLTALE